MDLVDRTVCDFCRELAADSPAPGGGSTAALAGALAASLVAMVARLTVGKDKYREVWGELEKVRDEADRLGAELTALVDKDTEAFNRVSAAFRLPKGTDEEKAARKSAIQEAMRGAAEVPLETLRKIADVVALTRIAIEKGNPNCVTDAGTAAQLLRAAGQGAAYNVRVNLGSLVDKELAGTKEQETASLLERVRQTADELDAEVTRELTG
jgi:glutamate formiminotransferase/formiminotetrahydrofolate cyclodeaminase